VLSRKISSERAEEPSLRRMTGRWTGLRCGRRNGCSQGNIECVLGAGFWWTHQQKRGRLCSSSGSNTASSRPPPSAFHVPVWDMYPGMWPLGAAATWRL